ncbi:triphosphoribosyl-dephospho-CoA synthase [Bradyrhizobium sp. RDM4]|uniref:triphosphoribosyl-dephospho-CoA synthase n=1 Tax=Bradyrhizobium sp. RDM4 TaxID=3378765 RepID=UPI0038FC6489
MFGWQDHFFEAQPGHVASLCLKREVEPHPKPGFVSHVESGAHSDMDAELQCRSADNLALLFPELAKHVLIAGLDAPKQGGAWRILPCA